MSLALRPAPMTDLWITEGAGLTDLDAATDGLSLIEAPGQRAEALAIAVALREAVANGQRAALITPDRSLTRRVAAALDRWGIVPDDSGGEPLSQTPPGRLLRQIAGLFGTRLTAGPLLAVLKHPLVATGAEGQNRGTHLLHTRDLELQLRRSGPAFPEASTWLTGPTAPAIRRGSPGHAGCRRCSIRHCIWVNCHCLVGLTGSSGLRKRSPPAPESVGREPFGTDQRAAISGR